MRTVAVIAIDQDPMVIGGDRLAVLKTGGQSTLCIPRVCACACVCARALVCVCLCVRALVCVCVCVFAPPHCVCVRARASL